MVFSFIAQALPLSPKRGTDRLYRSPLAREGSILLNILVALICVFSSLNSASVNVADQSCIWAEFSYMCFRGGQYFDKKKGGMRQKYNRLITMGKLKVKCKQVTSLPLSPKFGVLVPKSISLQCIINKAVWETKQNVYSSNIASSRLSEEHEVCSFIHPLTT